MAGEDESDERENEALDAAIAAVVEASDPYWAATEVCEVASEFITRSVVASSVFSLWSALTDRWELRVHRRGDTAALMHRIAADWRFASADSPLRAAHLERWASEVSLRAQRPSDRSGDERIALPDLDAVFESGAVFARVGSVRVLDGDDALEVDLALQARSIDRAPGGDHSAVTVRLRCWGVHAWALNAEPVDVVWIVDDHPALVPLEPWSRLSYRGNPVDSEATIAALHLAHVRALGGGMPTFLQPDSVFESNWSVGTAAVGPTSLMERYAAVLSRHGLEPILASAPAINAVDASTRLAACQVGSGYVIAERFELYGSLPGYGA